MIAYVREFAKKFLCLTMWSASQGRLTRAWLLNNTTLLNNTAFPPTHIAFLSQKTAFSPPTAKTLQKS